MSFYPGFDIKPTIQPMGFEYGPGVFGSWPQLVKELWNNFIP